MNTSAIEDGDAIAPRRHSPPMKRAPLSSAQLRLWLLSEISGPDTQYNVPIIVRCRSQADKAALRRAFHDVVLRHEILRTFYEVIDGVPVQVVQNEEAIPDLLSVETHDERLQAARLSEILATRFSLNSDLPCRAWLLCSKSAGDVLVIVLHHIAIDGTSLSPFLHDLETAYAARREGSAPQWEPLRLQYSDYAAWHRGFLGDSGNSESLSGRQLAYWRAQLAGLPERIQLPVDRWPPATTRAGGCVSIALPSEVCELVMEVSSSERLAPVSVFRAAVAAFLSRLGAGEDIPLAGFVSGRADGTLDNLVGMFVNTLVFRIDTSANPTFRELLRRVKEVEIQAYSHQDLPFDEVVKELQPRRSSTRQPLAQAAMSYETSAALAVPGLDGDVELGENYRAKFDLYVAFLADHGLDGGQTDIEMKWRYSVALFDEETIKDAAGLFTDFLTAAVRNVDQKLSSLQHPGPSAPTDRL